MTDDLNGSLSRSLKTAALDAGDPTEEGTRRVVQRAVGRRRWLLSGVAVMTSLLMVLAGVAVGQWAGGRGDIDPSILPPSPENRSTEVEITPEEDESWHLVAYTRNDVDVCFDLHDGNHEELPWCDAEVSRGEARISVFEMNERFMTDHTRVLGVVTSQAAEVRYTNSSMPSRTLPLTIRDVPDDWEVPARPFSIGGIRPGTEYTIEAVGADGEVLATWDSREDREKTSEESAKIPVASARDFDPHGDGAENPDEVELAWDGDRATGWTTSTYFIPFEKFGKRGVGLLFDLGRDVDVGQVDIIHDSPGAEIELRSGSSPGMSERDFDVVARATMTDEGTVTFAPGRRAARYWLLWFTALPDQENTSATITEVEFRR